MALEAGSVFVRLGGLFDNDGFQKWDAAVDSERTKARTPIEQKLGADSTPLDKDLGTARAKVSRWARTQDKISLGYDKGGLDKSLADARARVKTWGETENRFRLGYLKSSLDTALGEARMRIKAWAEVENKIHIGYNKGYLEAQLAEAKAQIRSQLGDVNVKVNLDTADAMAQAAALNAATGGGGGGVGGGGGGGGSGGGGGDGGGGFGDSTGRFLFGAGATSRRGRFLGAFSPFRMGIHGPFGAVGGALGLGPEHLLSAAAAVGGSAAGGLAGAGVTALGGLGTAAVGSGSDLAVVKSTITDTQALAKQYDALDQAVARYGAGSAQAKIAQFQLNYAMDQIGGRNGVGVKAEAQLARMTDQLNKQWDKATQKARVQAVGLLEQVVGLGKSYVPRVASAAEQNLAIINKGIKPLFDWLEGPHGVKIWNDLENTFKRNLPSAVHAFVQGVEFLLKVIDDASKYAGGFTQKLDEMTTRWNNMDPTQLSNKIAKLHADFKLWEDVIVNAGKDLDLLFKAGSGEGNTLVQMFDNLLKRWGDWERSARGQTALHQFFKDREQELIAILHIVGDVAKVYASFWAAFQPLVPAVTAFAKEISGGLSALIKNVVTPIAGAISWVLKGFTQLGQDSSNFKDLFIVPFGVFLVAWRLFGRDSAVQLFNLKSHLTGLRAVLIESAGLVKAVFTGGDVGGAWEKLKNVFKRGTPGGPAAEMEGAIVSGHKTGAALVEEAIIAGHRKGGAVAGTEIATEEAAGGRVAGTEIAAEERAAMIRVGGPAAVGGAGALTAEEKALAATGAAGGAGGLRGLLSRLRGGVGNALSAAAPLAGGLGAAYLINQTYGQLYQSAENRREASLSSRTGLDPAAISQLTRTSTDKGYPIMSPVLTNRPFGATGQQLVAQAESALKADDPKKIEAVIKQAEQVRKVFPQLSGPINQFIAALQHIDPAALKAHRALLTLTPEQKQWNNAFNKAWEAIHNFTVRGGESIKNIKDRFDTNMRLIQHTIGLHSEAGRKLANSNFDQMVRHVEHAMREGKISVDEGIRYMRRTAEHGSGGMRNDLAGHFREIVGIIHDSWKKGKTHTQTALADLRTIINDANKNSRADIVAHYKKLLQDNYDQWKAGNETSAEAAKKRSAIHRAMAKDLQDTQVKLTGGLAHILDGTNTATAKGVDKLFGVLNDALKKLSVTQIKWGVSNVGNVVQSSLGSIFKGVTSFGGSASIPSGVPSASNLQAAGFYRGGTLPGAEYGHDDVMTLVDPAGRPRAKMAGDEGILTRHQMPVVDYALNVAKAVGALPYGSLDEVWDGVTRPHGYERGGKLPRFAKGGKPAGGYVFPFGPGLTWGRTDMGLDMGGSGLIGAIGNAVITRSTPQNSGTGWPGAGGAGTGAMIVHQLTDGPDRGRYVYLAENVDPLVRQGQNVTAGQAIAHARGFYPFLEMGWATNASGTTAAAYHANAYPSHSNTPEGIDFTNFIHGLAHGQIVGGGLGGFGAPAPQWQNIKQPHLTGNKGPLASLGDGVLKHVTDAMNKYGQAHTPSGVAGPPGKFAGVPGKAWEVRVSQEDASSGTGWTELSPNGNAAARLGIARTFSNNAAHFPDFATLGRMYPRGTRLDIMANGKVARGVPQTDVGDGSSFAPGIGMTPALYGVFGGVPATARIQMSDGSNMSVFPGIGTPAAGFARGGRIGRLLDYMLHGPSDPNKRSKDDPAALSRFGINPENYHAQGGRLSNLIPNFARGGRSKKPSYSLYTPPKPPSRPKKPKVFHAHLPPSIAKYVGVIPGAAHFSADDAAITRLEDTYNRQESLFNLYDGGGGQLPEDDLDQLYKIRLQEWNILQKEWLDMPHFLEQIQQRISGHWEGHWDTGAHWKWVGKGKHRHRVPIASTGAPHHGRHPVYRRDRYDPGLRADVAHLEKTLTNDDKEISHLNNRLYKEHVRELKQKKAYTDQAYKIANGIASQVAKILDQIYNNLDAAHNISDEIAAINTASPAESLQGLTGPAYASAQQHNASLKAANHARTVRRHALSRERQRIADKNTHLHKQIRHLENDKSAAARRLHHEGFTVAWSYELDRLAIGEQIRHIRESMKELRDKLKEENKLLTQYEGAEAAINARLYGATAEDPTATGLRSTMGDIGMDILSLQQEGASVPQSVIQQVVSILTGDATSKPPKGLGLHLPPGFGSLTSGGETAAQALADFLSFQASRQNIFAQFGSNFVAAGQNPFPGNAGLAAGTQYYGAASGAASGAAYGPASAMGGGYASLAGSGGGSPGVTVNITQNYASGPPDPHTYAAGLGFELGALM